MSCPYLLLALACLVPLLRGHTIPSRLLAAKYDRNHTNVAVTYLTPHEEVTEGGALGEYILFRERKVFVPLFFFGCLGALIALGMHSNGMIPSYLTNKSWL